MFKRFLFGLLTMVVLAAVLHSHGAPLMGTVTAVGADSITIKDKAGKSVVVMLEKATKYLKDKKAAAMGDIQVGARVVIDAHMDAKTKKYAAEEVQIGVAADEKNEKKVEKAAPPKGAKKP